VCVAIGPEQLADAAGLAGESALLLISASPELKAPGSAYREMAQRGLERVVVNITAALTPLFVSGEDEGQKGLGLNWGAQLYTTVNPTDWPLVVKSVACADRHPVFRPLPNGQMFETESPRPAYGTFRTRLPRVDEHVVVIGRDQTGGYLSNLVRVKRGVNGGGSFDITELETSELPMAGGAVVALSDGSVLGLYGGLVQTFLGPRGKCYAFHVMGREPRALVATLASRYQSVSVAGWPAVQVTSAFDLNVSEPRIGLATVGSLALQSAVAASLVREGHADLVAVAAARLQDEVWLAMRAAALDLVRHAQFPEGVHPPVGTRVQATLLLALVGLARMNEDADVFDEFCEELGLCEAHWYAPVQETHSAREAPYRAWLALEEGPNALRPSSADV